MRLADFTVAGGEIARGANGLALLCGAGEAGELLGLVNQRDAARNFAGYTDAAATRRRLVRDVLKRGDCWFRTGDLLRTDAEGFVYFVDRLGDTFRYKGENVRPQGARVPCPRSQQPSPECGRAPLQGPTPLRRATHWVREESTRLVDAEGSCSMVCALAAAQGRRLHRL